MSESCPILIVFSYSVLRSDDEEDGGGLGGGTAGARLKAERFLHTEAGTIPPMLLTPLLVGNRSPVLLTPLLVCSRQANLATQLVKL